VFLPPLAVGIATDWKTTPVVVNILLFIFTLWIGAVIHAVYIVNREKGGKK